MDEINDNSELTFKMIWKKLKKAGVRILVYALIAVVVLTTVLGIVSVATKGYSYNAKVMFANEYANKGMSPWNTQFDPSGEIKSTYVVNQALENIGLNEEERIKLLPSVISAISVTADFDASDTSQVNTSFSYTVTLSNCKSIGLSKEKTQELLDNICDVFIKNYKDKYSYTNYAQSISADTVKKYNYIQAIDTMENNMNNSIKVAESMSAVNPSFRATESKMTFSDIVAELQTNETMLIALKAYASETGVESSQSTTSSEVAYLQQIKNETQSEISSLTSMITTTTASLDKFAEGLGNIKVSQDGTLNYDDSNYFALVNKLLDLESQKAAANKRLTYIEELQAGYGASSGFSTASAQDKEKMIATADSMVSSIAAGLEESTKKLNAAIAEFNDVENLKNAVVKLQAAQPVSIDGLSVKTILLADIAAIIVAFAIAMIVTDYKEKKKAKKVNA
ncbi:MAG: hypothetical protein ACI4MI_00150 [Christensenellales bacterium]